MEIKYKADSRLLLIDKGGSIIKYINQITIIFGVTVISEIISIVINNKMPVSIVGIILLFILLRTNIVRGIDETADFIVSNMSILYIIPAVEIIETYVYIKADIVKIVIICLLSTYITALSVVYSIRLANKVRCLLWNK